MGFGYYKEIKGTEKRWTKYGFGISKEVGNLRQRNHEWFNKVWI